MPVLCANPQGYHRCAVRGQFSVGHFWQSAQVTSGERRRRWERPVEFLKQQAGVWVRDCVPGVNTASVEFLSGVLGFCVRAIGLVAGINLTFHLLILHAERLQLQVALYLFDLNKLLAEREGFEPSIEFPLYTLSKRAPSTTRPSLRFGKQRQPRGRKTA